MKWRPIETAPMDGAEVLVCAAIAGVLIVHNARYVKAEDWLDGDEDRDGWWAYMNSICQEFLDGVYAPRWWAPMPEECA